MKRACLLGLVFSLVLTGCYRLRPSSGGGQTKFDEKRWINAEDVALPSGYEIRAVATGLIFPTGAAFDAQGRLHVVESGYAYGEVWTTPRLLRIEENGRVMEIAKGSTNGPWTGVAFHDGNFFVAEGGTIEGGKILKISPGGQVTSIVDGLPSFGDHHTDGPAVSRDGWIYFGQGTASNSGVIGEDNAEVFGAGSRSLGGASGKIRKSGAGRCNSRLIAISVIRVVKTGWGRG